MRHPAIEPLLILQDREQNRRSLNQNLGAVPGDRARVQAKIDAEKNAIEAAKAESYGPYPRDSEAQKLLAAAAQANAMVEKAQQEAM